MICAEEWKEPSLQDNLDPSLPLFFLLSAKRVWLVRLPPPLPGNEWLHWGHPPCGAKRHMDLMCTSRVSVQVAGRKRWWLYPVTEEAEGNWTEVWAWDLLASQQDYYISPPSPPFHRCYTRYKSLCNLGMHSYGFQAGNTRPGFCLDRPLAYLFTS